MKPTDLPPMNIEGVVHFGMFDLGDRTDTVTLLAPNIGVENDGGLLKVEILVNCPIPLIGVYDCPFLDADEAKTLIRMLAYGISVLEIDKAVNG